MVPVEGEGGGGRREKKLKIIVGVRCEGRTKAWKKQEKKLGKTFFKLSGRVK
jgi:hypothetical protein